MFSWIPIALIANIKWSSKKSNKINNSAYTIKAISMFQVHLINILILSDSYRN